MRRSLTSLDFARTTSRPRSNVVQAGPRDRLAELKAKNADLYTYIYDKEISKGALPEHAARTASRLVPGPR